MRVMRCSDCCEYWMPPQERCPACGSAAVDWMPVSGAGSLYTFTIIYRPGAEDPPGRAVDYPYSLGLVELDGAGGARIPARLEGCDAEDLRIGMRMRLRDSSEAAAVFVPLAPSS